MVRWFVGILAMVLSACACAQDRSASEARIQAAIQQEVASGFAGTVLIALGPATIWQEAYGEVGGVPMTLDTRYWISSMGKQFVSAAIMALHEDGRISLDDPVSRWFADAPADKRAITVRQLLSHTSGLPQGYVGEEASANAEAVRNILAVPLAAPVGERFIYSNDNYQLAAAIVERISGLSYRDFVRQRFFERLGLRNSGVANGPAGVAPTRDATPTRLLQPQWGVEGHYASGPDLLRWYRSLGGGEVLRRTSFTTLITPVVSLGSQRGALGWFTSATARGTERVWTRGNDDFGPNSLIYTYPARDLVIIVLSHAGQKTEELSYSRAMLAALEGALAL